MSETPAQPTFPDGRFIPAQYVTTVLPDPNLYAAIEKLVKAQEVSNSYALRHATAIEKLVKAQEAQNEILERSTLTLAHAILVAFGPRSIP